MSQAVSACADSRHGGGQAPVPLVDATIVATMHKLNLVARLFSAFFAEIADKVAALRGAVDLRLGAPPPGVIGLAFAARAAVS